MQGYTLFERLGGGATSEVYRALRCSDNQLVAVKKFLPVVFKDKTTRERLLLEAEVLRELNHENVVKLNLLCSTDEEMALDLELVEGGDLYHWLNNYKLALIEPKIWILVQILRGIAAAHEKEIIHRDLKPANILVSNSGKVKITDFGLAKSLGELTITKMGLMMGSMGYMAPELINGGKASYASDIFSFAVIAYEVLTGKPCFGGSTPQEIIKKIILNEFTPIQQVLPYLDIEIVNCLNECLQIEPQKRPQSVWLIEGRLMNYLQRTGLLALSPQLLDANVTSDLIKKTYEKKLSQLKSELDHSLTNSNKSKVIQICNDLNRLFPENNLTEKAISEIAKQNKNARGHLVFYALGPLVLFLVSLIIYKMFNQPIAVDIPAQDSPNISTKDPRENIISQEINSNSINNIKIETENNAKPIKAIPQKIKAEKGFVSFLIPEGVEAFVAGVKIPAHQLKKFPLRPGTHKIELIKEGFLPIQGEVKIKANKTSIVNAQGG